MDARRIETPDGTTLHVATCGDGPDVVVPSGGPGCVHYLADAALAPEGFRAWFPDPRGVGQSGGGPHGIAQAVADLEAVRAGLGLDRWLVLGHSWGSDLAVCYALDHPDRVAGVVGVAGHGLHRDREWSAAYQAGRAREEPVEIAWVPEVHAALWADFPEWIHEPTLWRRLADSPVPMTFVAAGADIRPSWPLAQLAELVPGGSFEVLPGAVHDVWHTEPARWREAVTRACRRVRRQPRGPHRHAPCG